MIQDSDWDNFSTDTEHFDPSLFPDAPLLSQFWAILKIRIIHRFRSRTTILEYILDIIFLIFLITFGVKSSFSTGTHEIEDSIIFPPPPFSYINGTAPIYGIIPDNSISREFSTILEDVTIKSGGQPIINRTEYFNTFEDYQDFVLTHKEMDEVFLATEQLFTQDNESQIYTISTNGWATTYLADYFTSIANAILVQNHVENPSFYFAVSPMVHKDLFRPDIYDGMTGCIFAFVFIIGSLLVTGSYFVEEAESGVRDLLTFSGLSNQLNNITWFVTTVLTLLIPSFIFSLVMYFVIHTNFFVIFLLYLVGDMALTSLFLCVISLYPKGVHAITTALALLLVFFILVFLEYFSWLREPGHDVEKNVLNIFPQACLGASLFMICNGNVNDFYTAAHCSEFNVKYAYVYLLVESIVYYLIFLLIDQYKNRQWLPAPRKWKFMEPTYSNEPINVKNLTKAYGSFKAVNDVSFSLGQREVLAIVGPNGAGKSTLMSMLCSSKIPTSGSITFQGVDISKYLVTMHKMTGYCPQDNIFLPTLKPIEWLQTICILRGNKYYDFLPILKALDLDQQLDKRIGEMSGGNKRKVCLAAALVCDPPIVLLDEATSGVDFTSRTRIWSLIASLKNKTIIMATHTLEECEKIADKIMILSHGKIDELNTPTYLRQQYKCGYIIDIDAKYEDQIKPILSDYSKDYTIPSQRKGDHITFSLPLDQTHHISEILKRLTFDYYLNVQSLEEMIFNKVQQKEEELQKDNESDSDDIIPEL